MIGTKKQRNHGCNLNRKAKKRFFANVGSSGEGLKAFWHNCMLYFSSVSDSREEKFFLTENDMLINDDYEIAKIFNNFFVNITKSLNITKWKDDLPSNTISEILYYISLVITLVF